MREKQGWERKEERESERREILGERKWEERKRNKRKTMVRENRKKKVRWDWSKSGMREGRREK